MLKKIITLFISATLALSALPIIGVQAASADNYQEILEGIGVLGTKVPAKITNDVFFTAIAGFFYDDTSNMTSESIARSLNAIDSTERFKASTQITVGEALKYSAIALGYDKITNEPTDEFLISEAAQLGLAKGLIGKYDDVLSSDDMIAMFGAMLEAEPVKMNFVSSNPSYSIATDETLLSMHRDIYYYRGKVTATELTSIDQADGVIEGIIELDNTEYYASDYAFDLLGKNIEAYIKYDDDENTVVYIGAIEKKNDILVIEARNIENVSDDLTRIEFYNEAEKLKTEKITVTPDVIYNGVFYGDYVKADFMPEQGSVELIDNTGDGIYDVVKITSYETMVADSVDTQNKTVTNRFGYTGNLSLLDVEDIEEEGRLRIVKGEEEIKFSAIKTNDVLNVAKSKGTLNPLCTIYVSSEKVQVDMKSISTNNYGDTEIETDTEVYVVSSALAAEMAHKNQNWDLSKNYVLYIDSFGSIAYFEVSASSDYCLFHRIYGDDFGDNYIIRYMTIDGVWKESPLAKKVKYNGTAGVKPDAVYNYLSQENPMVVKIKENLKGEINTFTMPTETTSSMEGSFTKTPYSSLTMWGTHFQNTYFMSPDCKVFVMPETPSRDKEEYYIAAGRGFFANERQYSISAYDIDEFGYTSVLSFKENASTQQARIGTNFFVVTDIRQKLSDDDEICTEVVGTGGGLKDLSFLTNKDDVINSISEGDVINFTLDKHGMISAVRSPGVGNLLGEFTEKNNTNLYHPSYNNIMKGTIAAIDMNLGIIKLNCEGSGTTFWLSSTLSCIEYDKKENECNLILPSSLLKGDKVVARISYAGLAEIIKVVE